RLSRTHRRCGRLAHLRLPQFSLGSRQFDAGVGHTVRVNQQPVGQGRALTPQQPLTLRPLGRLLATHTAPGTVTSSDTAMMEKSTITRAASVPPTSTVGVTALTSTSNNRAF